uniref:Dynein regulatory complex protein 10 n=1 Tax=Dunaliella tertiolecta TaxID=3047 RepID=A0A7S3QTW1_DUNTE|mmetsp:Transcript_9453/g.25489  ORF Transcript_9453/g.25489 Transcript_9453/m.25489 type:complete len:357 (+) Transcript_9453:86-1156(+)
MNSLEASRVLSVLDESLESSKLLSFVTTEVLDTAEQLKDLLGEDLVNTLVKHRNVVNSSAKGIVGSEAAAVSTGELVRLLKKSPTASRLQTLHTRRSPAITQVINFLERLRGYTQKRLTTTVEEDASNREYYDEVRTREEKAVAEAQALEQKLKLQRVELTRQAHAIQSVEDKSRAELYQVQTSTAAQQANITSEAKLTRQTDIDSHQGELENLAKELDTAKNALAKAREQHRETEAALRKAKKRAQQDVEAVIGDYDGDVGSRDREYQAALKEYNLILLQLEEYGKGHAEMLQERLEYEEQQRKLAQEKLQTALRQVRMTRAAKTIQSFWKGIKAKRALEAKKKKKAEAKAKKKP